MELILSEPEASLLRDILDERHLALQREIAHTDHREFRQILRDKEKALESLIKQLRGETPKAA